MENASKALIIAGSILIAIVLITIGIKILNSTSGVREVATSSMSAVEIQIFNDEFTKYNGEQTAEQVEKLINYVILNNRKNNNKQIGILLYSYARKSYINQDSSNPDYIQNGLNRYSSDNCWQESYNVSIFYTDEGLVNIIRIAPTEMKDKNEVYQQRTQ